MLTSMDATSTRAKSLQDTGIPETMFDHSVLVYGAGVHPSLQLRAKAGILTYQRPSGMMLLNSRELVLTPPAWCTDVPAFLSIDHQCNRPDEED